MMDIQSSGRQRADRVYCPIRRHWVAAIPEEIVRQKLIRKMISELEFPKSLIAVEKEIASLPNHPDCPQALPKRRLDLVCYATVKTGVAPLLVAECKSIPLNESAERQLFGYNASVGAPFMCLASGSEIKTLWKEGGRIVSVPFLPRYSELLKALCC